MLSLVRAVARVVIVVIAIATCLRVAPLFAAQFAYVSSTGSDFDSMGNRNPCTTAKPCGTPNGGITVLDVNGPGGQVNCLDAAVMVWNGFGGTSFRANVTVDCAGGVLMPTSGVLGFELIRSNQVLKLRNFTITGISGGYPAISVIGNGTLVLENCVFEYIGTGPALDIEPNGPLNLVIRNSRITDNAGGVLLKPAAGGSMHATLDHVVITNNGGGIKADSTNGVVDLDVTDSVISDNTNGGINAIAGTSPQTQNIVSIKNSVIARNGAAGVQANGGNAGVLVGTTILDQNGTATSAVNGGNLFTYGNNLVLGPLGSGFTGSWPLQ
jgi:hypothetical protein